ncbi:MAG: hypothetical protein NT062_03860 [Proteobacteria bacterium]|nr:hypothetical protein [Pseudomonadota bacterium]
MCKVAISLLVLVMLAGVAVSDRALRSRPDVTGRYQSNWDVVELVQHGDRVSGTYACCGGGTIEGRVVEDRVIRFVWKQPAGAGRGTWTIGPDRLDGTWGSGGSESSGGRWDLTRDRQASIAN